MGLFDELDKAGYVDKKSARRRKHQQRVEVKKKGYEGLDRERADHEAQLEEKRADQRRSQREKARAEERDRRERERFHQVRDLVQANLVTEGTRGSRSFFYVTRSGRVPFLALEFETAKKLESGTLAIVEIPGEPHERCGLVPRETAKKVQEFDPELVRFAAGRLG